MHEFIHPQICSKALLCTKYFLSAWDKSVKKNLDKDLCPYGDRTDYRGMMVKMTACFS